MSYTLIIVDVQDTFRAAREPRLQDNVKREIHLAMQHGAAIIFLEFVSNPPTYEEIVKLTHSYHKKYFALKSRDDGSLEVSQIIRHYDLNKDHIKVVGVNTEYCVRATVEGLANEIPNSIINVIEDACNGQGGEGWALQQMEKYSQVVIYNPYQEASL